MFREPKFAAYAYISQCDPAEEIVMSTRILSMNRSPRVSFTSQSRIRLLRIGHTPSSASTAAPALFKKDDIKNSRYAVSSARTEFSFR